MFFMDIKTHMPYFSADCEYRYDYTIGYMLFNISFDNMIVLANFLNRTDLRVQIRLWQKLGIFFKATQNRKFTVLILCICCWGLKLSLWEKHMALVQTVCLFGVTQGSLMEIIGTYCSPSSSHAFASQGRKTNCPITFLNSHWGP